MMKPCGSYISQEEQQHLPKINISVAALIDAENKVLIGRRISNDEFNGLWEFPGGKIKENETPEYALVRELKEELGIDVHPSCLTPFCFNSYSYPQFHLVVYLFLCRNWSNLPQSIIYKELKWVPVKELFKHATPTPEANKLLISRLIDGI